MKNISLPTIPENIPRARGRLSSEFGFFVLKLLGHWKITGNLPAKNKFVIAVAPHTSNWDFVIALAAMLALNLRVKFMAKKAIFWGPLKSFLLSLGGIAIDRNNKQGTVGQMVDQFHQHEQLILALAPEGTRSKTTRWKSGFLRIAHQARVPVVAVSLDFKNKEIHFHPEIDISADIEAELQRFKLTFDHICAKNPQAV
jgi:1-acyl-sn-glycerol-3-phosphate acyltransferase